MIIKLIEMKNDLNNKNTYHQIFNDAFSYRREMEL
ncbi:GNAT family acetyltransferase [Brachyspira pilosicoli P43/6/78]|uniref:GNAT family acetyltransferase n=1 Tax=Brachyspira pilosicoli P43/6/78 TaxID=1042417 RepID=A0A3B6VLY2_BRAPL|nr:GNAT family acetyltransferase [Brachyspira pilosicoli P43/6/78]